jgi:diadenylate cyclase
MFAIQDFFDVLLIAYLLFVLYKLLRDSVSQNIVIGGLALVVIYFLVRASGMIMMTGLLQLFINTGLLVVVVLFQSELRRFLLVLVNKLLKQLRWLNRLFDKQSDENSQFRPELLAEISTLHQTLIQLAGSRTGVLIIFPLGSALIPDFQNSVSLDAKLSKELLIAIFLKKSPIHDGAVIISRGRILSAGAVLPITDNKDLPRNAGLRHRAAVGVTEVHNVCALVVSEETGNISFAHEGELITPVTTDKLLKLLKQHYK